MKYDIDLPDDYCPAALSKFGEPMATKCHHGRPRRQLAFVDRCHRVEGFMGCPDGWDRAVCWVFDLVHCLTQCDIGAIPGTPVYQSFEVNALRQVNDSL